jgi:excisionase family DNA binding protein
VNVERIAYTVPEAAAALGISEDFLRNLIRRDEIPHVRLGRRVLIPVDALRALIGGKSEPAREEIRFG